MLERSDTDEGDELLTDAFGAMRDVAPPLREARELELRLQVLSGVVEREALRVSLRRPKKRFFVAFGSLAAAAAALLAYRFAVSPAPKMNVERTGGMVTLERDGRRAPPSGTLEFGDRLETASVAFAEFVGPERSSVRLEGGSEVTVLERELRLRSGSVHVSVPKLGPERSFVVETPGGRVVVHGTTFSVRVVEPTDSPCVSVEEGLVRVETPSNSTFIAAGESVGCEPEAPLPASSSGAPSSDSLEEAIEHSPPMNSAGAKSSGGKSLAAQNALFQKALRARRSGDRALAMSSFRELIQRYPKSPMAAQARLELERMGQR